MKYLKKALAILLSVAMVIGSLTVTALADQGKELIGDEGPQVNVTYLDANGNQIGDTISTRWSGIKDAWNTSSSTYFGKFTSILVEPVDDLTGLNNIETTMELPAGSVVTFDIKGYDVEGTTQLFSLESGSSKSNPGATLTIKDSAENSEGYITASNDSKGSVAEVQAYAILNMESGTIKDCTNSNDTFGGAIRIREDGTFNFSGGDIKKCTSTKVSGGAISNSGTLNMSGDARILRDEADALVHGNGLGIYNMGTVNMSGGQLLGFAGAKTTAAIYNSDKGTLITTKGTDGKEPYIVGNTYGTSGTMKLGAGYFDRNYTDGTSGSDSYSKYLATDLKDAANNNKTNMEFETESVSVTVDDETRSFILHVVEKDKVAQLVENEFTYYTVEAALLAANGKTVKLLEDAGDITVNNESINAKLNSNGYAVTSISATAGTLEIAEGTYNCNIAGASADSPITITGGKFDNSTATYTSVDIKGGYFKQLVTPNVKYACNLNTDPATMADYPYVVEFDDYMAKNLEKDEKYTTVKEALLAAEEGQTIQVLQDDTELDAKGFTFNKNIHVKLDLNGHILTTRFYINNDDADLLITDSSAGQTGVLNSVRTDANGGVIHINAGKVEAEAGTISAGALDADKNGGIVYITKGTEFVLSGAKLTGATADLGGAIYNRGTFTMTAGSIENCTSRVSSANYMYGSIQVYTYYSGAIYQDTKGSTTMTGGSIGTVGTSAVNFAQDSIIITGGLFNFSGTAHLEGSAVVAAGAEDGFNASIRLLGGTIKTGHINIASNVYGNITATGGLLDASTYNLITSMGTKTEYTNPINEDHRIGDPDPTGERYHFIENTDSETSAQYGYTMEPMTKLGYYDIGASRYYIYNLNNDIAQLDGATTITFLTNVTTDVTIPEGKDITFNLAGYTLTGNVTNNGSFHTDGNGTIAGNFTSNSATAAATIDNTTVTGNIVKTAGAITINSGSFAGTVAASYIYGGTFSSDVTAINVTNGVFNADVTASRDILGGYFDNVNNTITANTEAAIEYGIKGGYFASNDFAPHSDYSITPNTDPTTSTKYPYMVLAGNTFVAKNLTTQLYYAQIADALNAAESGDVIQIQQDTSAESGGITFGKQKSVTIDLAGHTVTTRLYINNANTNVTIIDSSDNHTGVLTSTRTNSNGGAIYIAAGTVTAESGTISATELTGEKQYGGIVYIADGATFNLAGATLTGGIANLGGAIYNCGTFNMSAGTITNCTSKTGSAAFEFQGSTIYTYYSGAIYQYKGASTVTGGSIGTVGGAMPSGTSTDTNGILIKNGSFTLKGEGHLEGITLIAAGASKESAKIILSDGTIKNGHINIATKFGSSAAYGQISAIGGLLNTGTYMLITTGGQYTEYSNPIDEDNRIGNPDMALDRYHFTPNTDEATKDEYQYTMEQMTPVCVIEEEEEDFVFYHISEALSYLADPATSQSGTIKFLDNVTEDFTIPTGVTATFDLSGKEITGNITNNGVAIFNGTDTVTGNITNNGTLSIAGLTVTGTITLGNGSTTNISEGNIGDIAKDDASSTVNTNITGGYFKTDNVKDFINKATYELSDYGGTTTYRYRVVKVGDVCTVTGATTPAVNGDYTTVQAAIEALAASEESGTAAVITFKKEIWTNETIEIPSGLTVTIDYYNNNISVDDPTENPIIKVENGATLNLVDTSALHNALVKGDVLVELGGILNVGKEDANHSATHGGCYAYDITCSNPNDVNVVYAAFVNQQDAKIIDENSIVVTGFDPETLHGCNYLVKSKYIIDGDTLQAALTDGGRYVVSRTFSETVPSMTATSTSGSINPTTGSFDLGNTIIDLNGKTITFKASRNPAIDVPSGASLTIQDSTKTSTSIVGGKIVAHTPGSANTNPNVLVKVENGGTFTLSQAELDAGGDKRSAETLAKNGDQPGTALYTEGTVNIKQFSTIKGAATTDTNGGSAIYVAGGTTTIARASISTTDTATEGVIKVVGGQLITTSNKNSEGHSIGPEISGYLYTDAGNDNSGNGHINLTAGYYTYDVDTTQPDFMGIGCFSEPNTDAISQLPYKINTSYVARNVDTGYTYATLQEAINDAQEGQTILVTVNLTTDGVEVPADKNIILDMNGKTFTGTGAAPIITNRGTLQIIDSSPEADNSEFTTYNSATRTQNVYDGDGGAIYNADGANLTIGGEYTRDGETQESDVIYFNRCKVSTDGHGLGGAIYNAAGATVNAYNTEITYCGAYRGGAIYNQKGTVNLTDSKIQGCTGGSDQNGTSIYNVGALALDGTTVVGSGAANVIHNYAPSGTTVSMTIPAGDTETFIFGKVGWGKHSSGTCESYVAGGYFSDLNGDETGKQVSSLQTGYQWKQLDTPVKDADDNEYSYAPDIKYVAKVTYSNSSEVNYNATLQNAIERADATEGNDNVATITLLCDITGEDPVRPEPQEGSEQTYQYYVSTNRNVIIDLAGYTVTEGVTKVDGVDHQFTMFQVAGELELTDSVGGGAITQGEYDADANITYDQKGGGVYVTQTGEFILSGQATIKNCYTKGIESSESLEGDITAAYGGGGIFNRNKVKICGNSVIKDCQALNNKGGGIYNDAESEMIMTDNALISNCRAYGNGGGIHTYNSAGNTTRDKMTAVYIYGGTIEKCWAGRITDSELNVEGNGGALCVSSNCIAYMFGGTMTYNRAYQYGGAVSISYNSTRKISGIFELYGIYGATPTITHNQCGSNGGGIYLADDAKMGVWGSMYINDNHAVTKSYRKTWLDEDATYQYIDKAADNNLFVTNDTVKVDGPLVTGSEQALDTYKCAKADTTDETIPGTPWYYDTSNYTKTQAYPQEFKVYADYINLTKSCIRVSVPTLEENPIFAKRFSEEATWKLPNGDTVTLDTPGSCFDNFNTYTVGANAGETGNPVIDSDEPRFDVVASREIWDGNKVPQTGSYPSKGKKSDDYNNVIYLFLAEIDAASVTLANEFAINYQCSITDSKYQEQLRQAGKADVMLLEVSIASDTANAQVIPGVLGDPITKYDELTGKEVTWQTWSFKFDGIDPCWMAEDITTDMYLGYWNASQKEYVKTSKRLVDTHVYSIAEYCNDAYYDIVSAETAKGDKITQEEVKTNEALKHLLADILVYGETAQLFQHYKTDTLCTKVDWSYHYDGRGEVVKGSRTMINTKPNTEITLYSESNEYWDARGEQALRNKGNSIFDMRGYAKREDAKSDQESPRWDWIETWDTNTAGPDEYESRIPSSVASVFNSKVAEEIEGLVDPNAINFRITAQTLMFGKGGYVVPRFYVDLGEITEENLKNVQLKVELLDANDQHIKRANGEDATEYYAFSKKEGDQYYVDLGRAADDTFMRQYPQEFGYKIRTTICAKQQKGTKYYRQPVQILTYSVDYYLYKWVHRLVKQPETMSNTQYAYMQDLAYAVYRYGKSTAQVYTNNSKS